MKKKSVGKDNSILDLKKNMNILNLKIEQQNKIIMKLSSLLLNISDSSLDLSKVQQIVDDGFSEKVSLLNSNFKKILSNMSKKIDKKLILMNNSYKKDINNINDKLKKIKTNQVLNKQNVSFEGDDEFDLFKTSQNSNSNDPCNLEDMTFLSKLDSLGINSSNSQEHNYNLNPSINNNNNNNNNNNTNLYESMKKEILSDIYKDLYINSIRPNINNKSYSSLKNSNNTSELTNKLDFEFNQKLKRNKREIIKQKMLEIISNKKITTPELKEEIVNYNGYCSKATFYRYYNSLKAQNAIIEEKKEFNTYLSTPTILQKYERNK